VGAVAALSTPEAFRYVMVGVANLAASVATLILLVEKVGLRPQLAGALCFSALFVANFALARYLIFRVPHGPVLKQFIRYGSFNLLIRVAEYAMFLLFLNLVAFQYSLSLVASLVVSNLVKFWCYKYLIFASRAEGRVQNAG
jgi:putative flippase GtrA